MRAEQISQRLIKPTARIFCLGQEFQGLKWFFFIGQRKVCGEIRARGRSSFTQAERKAKVNITSTVLILNNTPPQHGFLKSIQNSPKQTFTTAKIWRVKQKAERLTVAVSWHAGSSDVRRSVNASEIRRESQSQRFKPRLLFSFESQVTLIYSLPAWHHCHESSPDLG